MGIDLNVQVTLNDPLLPQGLSVVEKFSASISLAHCLIPDEMMLKQLEVILLFNIIHSCYIWDFFWEGYA